MDNKDRYTIITPSEVTARWRSPDKKPRRWHATKQCNFSIADVEGHPLGIEIRCRILDPDEFVANEREYAVEIQFTRDGQPFGETIDQYAACDSNLSTAFNLELV